MSSILPISNSGRMSLTIVEVPSPGTTTSTWRPPVFQPAHNAPVIMTEGPPLIVRKGEVFTLTLSTVQREDTTASANTAAQTETEQTVENYASTVQPQTNTNVHATYIDGRFYGSPDDESGALTNFELRGLTIHSVGQFQVHLTMDFTEVINGEEVHLTLVEIVSQMIYVLE
ncbi:hypothetical protein F4818DRAFT_430227 [Hypoxylon cercidicola]|nr:hypothetical protein F4818DRAFT_430227 [Hypoxylon cercidicola]